jgi:hypothetical protein
MKRFLFHKPEEYNTMERNMQFTSPENVNMQPKVEPEMKRYRKR